MAAVPDSPPSRNLHSLVILDGAAATKLGRPQLLHNLRWRGGGGGERGVKNPICAQADQHDSSGWNLRPKCLPKRKRCSSIVSMEDKGASARIAGAAAAMRYHRQARQGQGLGFTTTYQDNSKLLLPSCSRYHRRDGPRSVVQPPSYPVAFHSTALRESCN